MKKIKKKGLRGIKEGTIGEEREETAGRRGGGKKRKKGGGGEREGRIRKRIMKVLPQCCQTTKARNCSICGSE